MYQEIFERVKKASQSFCQIDSVDQMLLYLADLTEQNTDLLLQANQKDLDRMDPADPKYDRLKLTAQRISDIAKDMRSVSALPSVLGKILAHKTLSNGLDVSKISVPIGVIGIIYEARPNVTWDVFSLCIKSGNACILKGGSDAQHSNEAIVLLIEKALKRFNTNSGMIALLPPEREATAALLNARGYVDLVIPRGSQGLINYVCENAKIPVIETGAGIVHTFFDQTGNRDKARIIINNAKTRRVSVCNALDCLIIHQDRLADLPYICELLAEYSVIIYADSQAYNALKNNYPNNLLSHADNHSFGTEFMDYKMSIKTVKNMEEALAHIERYSSMHSEAIISEDATGIELFLNRVDAAVVYANTSTAFTDGAQFGLGAEIGISTQKLHARGPMACNELTSYKWVVKGNGQIRK